ncbi:MAG: SUMF1/EgtB/PvdO family nonheme iron enzyme [Myxococcota bacterium]
MIVRAFAGVLIVCAIFTVPSGAQEDPIVFFEGGHFIRGLHALELPRLLRDCRLRALIPQAQCAEERFVLEQPRRRIGLSRYGLDRYEVTNAAYLRCVRAGVCVPPRMRAGDVRVGRGTMPVSGVTADEAARYCEWVGGRLPSESQWERAARGPAGRTYPWGRIYNDRLSNHGRGGEPDPVDGYAFASPVGSFPAGATPEGVHDLAGNVWEWTADRRSDNSDWQSGLAFDPTGDESGGERIIRGGSWRAGSESLRGGMRVGVAEQAHAADLGFRCAYAGR